MHPKEAGRDRFATAKTKRKELTKVWVFFFFSVFTLA